MLKAERASFVLQRLQELYPETPVPLDHRDPFTLLIAVLLSAQCTDERVNQVTPALFALADNPLDMAALEVDQIRAIIRPCGLSPQKSKAIMDSITLHNGNTGLRFHHNDEDMYVGNSGSTYILANHVSGDTQPAIQNAVFDLTCPSSKE